MSRQSLYNKLQQKYEQQNIVEIIDHGGSGSMTIESLNQNDTVTATDVHFYKGYGLEHFMKDRVLITADADVKADPSVYHQVKALILWSVDDKSNLIHGTQADIAKILGVGHASVERAMKKLQDIDMIKYPLNAKGYFMLNPYMYCKGKENKERRLREMWDNCQVDDAFLAMRHPFLKTLTKTNSKYMPNLAEQVEKNKHTTT